MKRKISYCYQCHLFLTFICCVGSVYASAQDFSLKDETICEGQTINLGDQLTGIAVNSFDGWYWGDGVYDNGHKLPCDTPFVCSISPVKTTKYGLRYIENGNYKVKELTITVIETPILTVPAAETICSGATVTLKASVSNSYTTTIISWSYAENKYDNGATFTPNTLGTHTYSVVAVNANKEECEKVTKDYVVNVEFNPITARCLQMDYDPRCSKTSINLNDLVDFFVFDPHGNRKPASSHTGNIVWRNSDYTVISSPNVTLGTSNALYYADVSNVKVFHNENVCSPNFEATPIVSNPITVKITSGDFTVKYNDHCFGDPVVAVFEMSDCDEIDHLEMSSTHTPLEGPAGDTKKQTMKFNPFIGLEDIIKVKGVTKKGFEKIFELSLRKPTPPSVRPLTIQGCENTSVTFAMLVDSCDIINVNGIIIDDIFFTVQEPPDEPFKVFVTIPKLPNMSSFHWRISYYSTLEGKDILKDDVYTDLDVWSDSPKLDVMLYDSKEKFESNQILCAGDSLIFHVFSPNDCDFIKDYTWIQGAGTLILKSDQEHEYYFKVKPPTTSGTTTYHLRVNYQKPGVSGLSSVDISRNVIVAPSPKIFLKNPPDMLEYCYSNDPLSPPLDISALAPRINNEAVEPGSVKFRWNFDLLTSIKPAEAKNYVINANYKYKCSAMTSTNATDEIFIAVSKKEDPAAAYVETKNEFCIADGVDIKSISKEGTNLNWKHEGKDIKFPYYPALPGAHTLTVSIYNRCYPYPDEGLSADIKVTVHDRPTVTAMDDDTVCYGATVALTANYVGQVLSWTTLPPNPVVIDPSVVITETTTFVAHVESSLEACGTAFDEVTIFLRPYATVQVMRDTAVCLNDEIQLRVLRKEGDVSWVDLLEKPLAGENPTVKIVASSTYKATATNVCGSSIPATVPITALPLPFVEVVADTSICYGEPFVPTYRNASGILTWEPKRSVAMTDPVTFVCTAATEKCGIYRDTIQAHVYPQLFLTPGGDKIPNYKRTRPYDFNFTTSSTVTPILFDISGELPIGFNASNGHIFGVPTTETEYKTYYLHVDMEDGNGCKVTKNYTLSPEWWAPNVMLPLGDAENAEFLPGFEIEVYTRNGILIHKGTGWNGRNNNALVPEGTYFYKVKAMLNGVNEEHMGYVVVMYN